MLASAGMKKKKHHMRIQSANYTAAQRSWRDAVTVALKEEGNKEVYVCKRQQL